MAYGTYMNNYSTNPYGYMGNNYYGANYQPNIMQNQMQAQQNNQYSVPIEGVIFLTSDEAKAYIVPPNKRVMIMDRDKSIFYIKSADALGQSNTSAYRFEPLENAQPKIEIETTTTDVQDYVKKDDIKGFATTDDLASLKNELSQSMEDLKKSFIKRTLNS